MPCCHQMCQPGQVQLRMLGPLPQEPAGSHPSLMRPPPPCTPRMPPSPHGNILPFLALTAASQSPIHPLHLALQLVDTLVHKTCTGTIRHLSEGVPNR